MTTLVWTGVALLLALKSVVALRMFEPAKATIRRRGRGRV